VILVIAGSPACRLCQRRCNLAQQHLEDYRDLALLSCTQVATQTIRATQSPLDRLSRR
jgi:hypothetical protein